MNNPYFNKRFRTPLQEATLSPKAVKKAFDDLFGDYDEIVPEEVPFSEYGTTISKIRSGKKYSAGGPSDLEVFFQNGKFHVVVDGDDADNTPTTNEVLVACYLVMASGDHGSPLGYLE